MARRRPATNPPRPNRPLPHRSGALGATVPAAGEMTTARRPRSPTRAEAAQEELDGADVALVRPQ